jgi:PAS domain S-box-containing protein
MSVRNVTIEHKEYMVVVARDITERKQAEQALKESEEKYRGLFENSTGFAYLLDLKGNFVDVNHAAERLTGYTKAELIGMNYRDYTASDAHGEIFEAFNSVFETGKPVQDLPLVITVKDGTEKYFETSVGPLIKDRNTIGFHGISRDITERK